MMPAVQPEVWTIEPRREGMRARARDLWRYRRLLRFFATKALEKLYKRTVLGWAWLFIRPLFPLLVKTLIFGGVLAVGSGGIPYFLFLVVGTAVWELFAGVAQWGTRSLELNRGFLSRIYVPRLILPIAMGTPAFLTFAIHAAVIVVAVAYYRVTAGTLYFNPTGLGWAVQALALAWVMGLGLSLWTSVPALLARDVRFTLNYVLGFWVFLTPVMYPMSSVPADKRWLMSLNPLTAVVESFKFGILGSQAGAIDLVSLATAWTVALATLVFGLSFFGRAERDAADKV
jgi:lipopolysaccharide transport system permease protein